MEGSEKKTRWFWCCHSFFMRLNIWSVEPIFIKWSTFNWRARRWFKHRRFNHLKHINLFFIKIALSAGFGAGISHQTFGEPPPVHGWLKLEQYGMLILKFVRLGMALPKCCFSAFSKSSWCNSLDKKLHFSQQKFILFGLQTKWLEKLPKNTPPTPPPLSSKPTYTHTKFKGYIAILMLNCFWLRRYTSARILLKFGCAIWEGNVDVCSSEWTNYEQLYFIYVLTCS